MAPTLQDVMTADPATLTTTATLGEAARLMRDEDIGDVIVVEGDTVVGILTDRDIVVRAVADGQDPSATTVGEVCSRDLVTLAPGDSLSDADRIMRERAVRRLPVVDEGRAVGIVSLGDLALGTTEKAAGNALADISASPAND